VRLVRLPEAFAASPAEMRKPAPSAAADFLMSNAQRRLKNEEVGIHVRTKILFRKDLGTLYLVLSTFLNIECPTPIEE
jgi:hypothetical protein